MWRPVKITALTPRYGYVKIGLQEYTLLSGTMGPNMEAHAPAIQ